ncbi:MAG: DUF1947 domain-containing protein [Candidatus Methanomethylicaceae archaeon]
MSSKEQKELLGRIKENYPLVFEKIDRRKGIEVIETADGKRIYIQDGAPILFTAGSKIVPCLRAPKEVLDALPKVVVDMGAVPHILNGADVMAPGIMGVADAKVGDVVVVVEERYGKPLAVGMLIADPKEIQEKKKGKAVENLHHLGDDIWVFVQKRI